MDAPCPGCGLRLPEHDGPTHAYVGASAACWALYGELLARDYGTYGMPDEHKYVVDAYMVQHPGVDEHRSRQSVAVHMIRLCLMLERERSPAYATRLISRATNADLAFPWFAPSTPLGSLTVADVLAAPHLEAHRALAKAWGIDQWEAWSDAQQHVRRWCDTLESR